jgi:YD repeat-containing protein
VERGVSIPFEAAARGISNGCCIDPPGIYTDTLENKADPFSKYQTTGLTPGNTQCYAYDTAGVTYQTADGSGSSAQLSTDSTTSYSLPTTVTPNGNSALATSTTYASSFATTSVTGPNGAQGTTTYDSYGRPSQTQIPNGAVTTYTYSYNPPTQTATVDGRWTITTLDGFGRTIRVQTGNGSTTVSTVDTQYAPCACSPLGKLWRVSMPYAPGGTPVWTTYTYDGSGRTLSVTLPDNGSATQLGRTAAGGAGVLKSEVEPPDQPGHIPYANRSIAAQ